RFFVNTELRDWSAEPKRFALLSSFGFTGTNAHAVLEEWQPTVRSHTVMPAYLLVFSAKTKDAHDRRLEDFSDWLDQNVSVPLEDISFTLCAGRSHFAHRSAFVVESRDELRAELALAREKRVSRNRKSGHIDLQARPEKHAIHGSSFDRDNLLNLADLYVRGA